MIPSLSLGNTHTGWWARNGALYKITTIYDKPAMIDDVHTEASNPLS